MKKIILSFIVFSFILNTKAQHVFEMPLWNSGYGNCLDKDASDANITGFLSDNPNGEAIIICPGGGYRMLCSDYEGSEFAPIFNKNGISLFVLKYRLPKQRNNVPLADAQQALTIVRNHAKEWKINPSAIGIMGSSAGGHLASTVATHFTNADNRPDFQILLYPVITMNPAFTHKGTYNNLIGPKPSKEIELNYSNEKQVSENTPPAFVVLSCDDKIVPVKNSLVYVEALASHGVQCSLHMYPEGYHGFGAHTNFKDFDIWIPELLRWLKKEIKH